MTDLHAHLAGALGAAYRLERELGGGGMSRVFLAEETALGRQVVIKVLPPEAAAGVSEERFRREIQVAAQLQHPNIVPLLAAGAAGDLLYYVMPYIAGESLRARLARDAELPVDDAARILRDVADALEFAHARGVVHRDIKPDNVMLTHGHAMVTDFGVSKAIGRSQPSTADEADSASSDALTPFGVALGTPAYMAPEQAAGDANVDHRADIYALGIVAYEMLAGESPFQGRTAQALINAHFTQTPESLAARRPSVPPVLNAVVMRCLEKRAADRWQRVSDIIPHLDAVVSGSTTAAAGLTAGSPATATARRVTPARVAMIFTAASAATLALVWALVIALGLPQWVLATAAVLLVLGFPLVMLTALRERARQTSPGLADRGVLERALRWRNALGGGAIAFGSLGAATAGFVLLRALGVGGFATLLSAGVLETDDAIVIADFANRTGDSTLATSITEAIRVDLAQSRVLRIVEANRVAAALRRMQRNPDDVLTEGLARDVAEREGAKAVVAGEIAPLGAGFVLAARIVTVGDSSTLISLRETASSAEELIPAVERLSRKLRERVGESLRSIRATAALDQVTTASLPALRAYSEGSRLYSTGRRLDAIQHLRQAVELDSTFGMAWRKLGVALGALGSEQDQRLNAVRRAYELRGRMTPLEAAHTVAYYHLTFLSSPDTVIDSYQRLLASWPDDLAATNNLAVMLSRVGRLPEAELAFRRVVAMDPGSANARSNLAGIVVRQGGLDEADSVLGAWERELPGSWVRMQKSAQLSFERGQFGPALSVADSLLRHGTTDAAGAGHELRRTTLRLGGRFREAEVAAMQSADFHARIGQPTAALFDIIEHAFGEAFVLQRPSAAVQRLDAARARFPLDAMAPASRPYGELAFAYATAGRLDKADSLLAVQRGEVSADDLSADGWPALAAGVVALERGDSRGALGDLREAARRFGCPACTALHEGLAFDRLGQPDSALAAYERVTNLRTLGVDARDFILVASLRRAGELRESRADRDRAREHYARAAELWKDADPELQPLVRLLRQRALELAGEPTGR